MNKHLFLIVPLLLILTGCGVETATTAATAAQLKAEEAKQAQLQLENARKQIDEMNQMTIQRMDEIEQQAVTSSPSTGP